MGQCSCLNWHHVAGIQHERETRLDLKTATRHFRSRAEKAVQSVLGDAGAPLADAAGLIAQVLLQGIYMLPDIDIHANVNRGRTPEEVAALEVSFNMGPFVAEVATRSRISREIHLAQKTRFALLNPQRDGRPVILRVEGLAFRPLPEIPLLRKRLIALMDGNYDQSFIYAWWLQHKDTQFPLESSKLHRIYESLAGLRSLQAHPNFHGLASQLINGLLHTVNEEIEAFEFWPDKRLGARVTYRAHSWTDSDDADATEVRQRSLAAAESPLGLERPFGEKFAASTMNFAAAQLGLELGVPGADPKVIAKLFSAARWWGSGEYGWQRWDETWLCTDKVNVFGRVVDKNGRLIWRAVGAPSARPKNGARVRYRPSEIDGDAISFVAPIESWTTLLVLILCTCGCLLLWMSSRVPIGLEQ